MKITFLLAIAALLLVPAAAGAGAEGDAAWRSERRSLDVGGHSAGFSFTSARRSELATDTLSGGFDSPSAHLTVDLLAAEPEVARVRLDVTWTGLIEYRDADGNGRYGLADETVQHVRLPGLPQQTAVRPVLGGGSTATVTYTLPGNASQPDPLVGLPQAPGVFRLVFTLVPDTAGVGLSAQEPTDVRLRTEVRGFPFQAGDTRLAVVADIATDAAVLEPTAGGLAAASASHGWTADWARSASSDGAEVAAAVSSLADDADRATAVLSLPRGDDVSQEGSVSAHHVQTVAEILRSLPPGDWRFYAVGLAGAALALGIPSLRRLREA